MSSFGENLKRIRESNSLSQKGLAQMLEISQQRVSEWECGKVEPTLYNIIRIIKVLDTTFDELTENIPNINNDIIMK